jgi:hypothetical protein
MNLSLEINRKQPDNGKETLGTFNVIGSDFSGVTMELPYKDNQHQISCIPSGVYFVEKRYSPEHGNHFHVLDVPNRDMILIHEGNYVFNYKGCIGVGAAFADINKDGLMDITDTKNTLKKLYYLMPQTFKLTIK